MVDSTSVPLADERLKELRKQEYKDELNSALLLLNLQDKEELQLPFSTPTGKTFAE